MEHPFGGQVLAQMTPESILDRVEGDAVAENGCAEVARTRRNPTIDDLVGLCRFDASVDPTDAR